MSLTKVKFLQSVVHLHLVKRVVLKRSTEIVGYLKSELHTGARLPPPYANTNMTAESPANNVQISVCQLTSTDDKASNLEVTSKLIRQAALLGSKIIFLPECFDYVGQDKTQSANLSETMDGEIMSTLKGTARSHGVWLSLGGFHERQPTNRSDNCPWLSNIHVLIDDQGNIASSYRKIHLFSLSSDVLGPGRSLRESDVVIPGNEIMPPVSSPIGKLGLGICYDLRFPEFSRSLRSLGAEVLTFPSAFTVPTGTAHWESLLRARAIENQCYVIAAAQVGIHNQHRASYGHSMVVDPWGKIVAEAKDDQSLLSLEIDLNLVSSVRRKMEVFNHRRPDVYLAHSPKDALAVRMTHFTVPDSAEDEEIVSFGHVKLKRRFIFLESLHSRAFVNRKCVLPGHVLVISKRVAFRLHDLSSEEVADMFQLVQVVQKLVEDLHNTRSSSVTVQDGPDSGQTVQHVHVHVIPRKPADFKENDSIYEKLATHDKGEVKWRLEEEMSTESSMLRNFYKTNHI